MSLDATLIDLDDRILYNLSGGIHLWWMLPKVKGHRIIITHDNNCGTDFEEYTKFESLGYTKVDCDLLCDELDIDFSLLPEDSLKIAAALVDLGYGLFFKQQHLNYGIDDLKLENGIDKESRCTWFKIPSITSLLNCTECLQELIYSDENLLNKDFIENLKEFGELADVMNNDEFRLLKEFLE